MKPLKNMASNLKIKKGEKKKWDVVHVQPQRVVHRADAKITAPAAHQVAIN